MDNLAHALVGAALMRAVADRHVPRAALLGIVAANAPDLSELFIGLPGTRADFLVLHRGITHSLVGAVVEIVGLTLLIGLGWRVARWILSRHARTVAVPAWNWLALGIAAAVLSHLYMDWQGSYGWRPFLPWNGTWYHLDWVAIVDPFFWLVPLVALAWGAERHWTPLAAVLAVGGTITFFVARAHDVVATWLLVVYAIACVVAAIGWSRCWCSWCTPVRKESWRARGNARSSRPQSDASAQAHRGRRSPTSAGRLRGSRSMPAPIRSRATTGGYRDTCTRGRSSAPSPRRATGMQWPSSPGSWQPRLIPAVRRSTCGMRATRAGAAMAGQW